MSSSPGKKATKPEARHKGAGQNTSSKAAKIPKPEATGGKSSSAKVKVATLTVNIKDEKKDAVSSLTTESLKDNPFIKFKKDDPNMSNNPELGSGSFAKVYIQKLPDGKMGACKLVSKIEKVTRKLIKVEIVYSEVNIWKALSHRNLLRFHDCYETPNYYVIFSDLCQGGDLFDWINDYCEKYTEREVATITKQTLEGLKYLHEHNIVHRDIKPENILMCNKTLYKKGKFVSTEANLDPLAIVIADFGYATIMENNNYNDNFGTKQYRAPEIASKKPYNEKVDIWAVGTITYIMLEWNFPFSRNMILEFNKAKLKYELKAMEFIKSCLEEDFCKRPSAKELLGHKWFALLKDKRSGTSDKKEGPGKKPK